MTRLTHRFSPIARVGIAATLSATLIASPAARAQGPNVVLDFSEYARPTVTEHPATIGVPLTSKGYDFYAFYGGGARNVLGTWGTSDASAVNRPTNIGGSTALFGTDAFERIDMNESRLARYRLHSMDVAHLYAEPTLVPPAEFRPITLRFFRFSTIEDFFFDTPTGFQDFVLPAPDGDRPLLNTLTFNSDFRAVFGVFWYQVSTSASGPPDDREWHQFTNIVVATVPEPATVTLVATGLLVVVGVGVRRRRGVGVS